MVELKLLLFTVPVGFNTFFIRVISAVWIYTTVGFPHVASHAGTEKPPHLMIIFAWDVARGKNTLKSGLTCQSLKRSFSWPEILSVLLIELRSWWWWGVGGGFMKGKKKVKEKRKKKKNSWGATLCSECAKRWLLYRLQSFISYMGTHWISRGQRVVKEKGVGVGFSLSQFTNELRLSGPGQPWGDPSEKD